MNRRISVAAFLAAFLLVPAGVVAKRPHSMCYKAHGVRASVIKQFGKRAPGRNICRHGIRTGRGTRHATVREKAKYLRALKRLNGALPALSAGAPKVPPAGTSTPRIISGHLASIRQCESGGNYRAVSSNGMYFGAFQFSVSTWHSVGGVGNPADASPAEQDKRAAILYARSGPGQWPVCQHR